MLHRRRFFLDCPWICRLCMRASAFHKEVQKRRIYVEFECTIQHCACRDKECKGAGVCMHVRGWERHGGIDTDTDKEQEILRVLQLCECVGVTLWMCVCMHHVYACMHVSMYVHLHACNTYIHDPRTTHPHLRLCVAL